MLGEFDLAKPPRPGDRMSSMMSPSVVLRDGRPRLVVGSAGSARLRGAIMQIVVNVVGHGLGVREAIEAPRVHLEDDVLHCEGGADAAELDRLESMGWQLVRWRRRNLYFGGVAAVEVGGDGTLSTDGDWRSAADERRYLKALRRYPHAAVFVAEAEGGRLVGRLSLARDTHPA